MNPKRSICMASFVALCIGSNWILKAIGKAGVQKQALTIFGLFLVALLLFWVATNSEKDGGIKP